MNAFMKLNHDLIYTRHVAAIFDEAGVVRQADIVGGAAAVNCHRLLLSNFNLSKSRIGPRCTESREQKVRGRPASTTRIKIMRIVICCACENPH